MARERPDPDALLCARCGYPLDDVLDEPACPECGTPVAESLPETRVGSLWQKRPSLGSWLRTLAAQVRWRGLFDTITIGRNDADWLLRVNLALASVLLAGAFTEPRVDQVFLHTHGSFARLIGELLVLTPGAYILLRGLTAIERAGLRFFGNRRGGRITPGIARTVTAHASYGWVLAGLLATIGAFVGHAVLRPWYNRVGAGWILTRPEVHVAFALGGFFLGLLWFEILSYLGAMRCRFANPRGIGREGVNEAGPIPEPTVDDHAHALRRHAAAEPVSSPPDAPDRAGG